MRSARLGRVKVASFAFEMNQPKANDSGVEEAADAVGLTNCDREPIHIPGQIQPHGILLVLREPQLQIVQVSENVAEFVGVPTPEILGRELRDFANREAVEAIFRALAIEDLPGLNPLTVRIGEIFCQGTIHRYGGALILELEPKQNDSFPFEFYRLLKSTTHQLREADSLLHLCQKIVGEVRRITGFDRVMVYRFEPDDSGSVIAEAKEDGLDSYLGLRYPASDIPEPARHLYYRNWLRLIPDVSYRSVALVPHDNPLTNAPLDLSYSHLRSVSPLHVEYLQNMGVAASMSVSLINDRRLWGLIACHHNSPHYIDYEVRKTCEFLGQLMSVEIFRQQQQEVRVYDRRVKSIQEQIRQELGHCTEGIETVLNRHQGDLLSLVQAKGLAIALGDKLELVGQTPSEAQTRDLIAWLRTDCCRDVFHTNCRQEVFHTDALAKYYPPARSLQARASGLLSISIFLNTTSYHILWFRPEQAQTVTWAGKPNKPTIADEDGSLYLSPRQSFQRWQETVREQSLPWPPLAIEAARELRNTLLLAALEFSQAALQEAARRAEIANRAKSQFLAKMSHELRTPLNAILGFSQVLSREGNLSSEQRKHIDIINRSGEHLLALINDVLEMSRIEAGQLFVNEQDFDLHRAIASIYEMMLLKATDKGLNLEVVRDEALPQYVRGDEGKLRQIVLNLTSNAVKFTSVGEVRLRVSSEELSREEILVRINVEDTGSGIPADKLEAIFEPFKQAETGRQANEGTGLGLSISRQYARLMGGDLTVESLPERGSTFTCTVKLKKAQSLNFSLRTNVQKIVGLAPGQPNYRLLVVEDVVENRQLMVKLLESVGFEVRSASNGAEAIALWQQWHPHCIWMDMRMPVMDGYQATRRLRAMEPSRKTVILALTASVLDKQPDEVIAAGCDDFVSKPLREEYIFEKMAQHLGVCYQYETEGETAPAVASANLKEAIALMPQHWQDRVYRAALSARSRQLEELITRIPSEQASLASLLSQMLENFNYEGITEAIEANRHARE